MHANALLKIDHIDSYQRHENIIKPVVPYPSRLSGPSGPSGPTTVSFI